MCLRLLKKHGMKNKDNYPKMITFSVNSASEASIEKSDDLSISDLLSVKNAVENKMTEKTKDTAGVLGNFDPSEYSSKEKN